MTERNVDEMIKRIKSFEQGDAIHVFDRKTKKLSLKCGRCGAPSIDDVTPIKHDDSCIYALVNEDEPEILLNDAKNCDQNLLFEDFMRNHE